MNEFLLIMMVIMFLITMGLVVKQVIDHADKDTSTKKPL